MSKHENNLPLCDLAEESQPLGMNVDATAEDDAGSGDRVIVPGNVIASITCYTGLYAQRCPYSTYFTFSLTYKT